MSTTRKPKPRRRLLTTALSLLIVFAISCALPFTGLLMVPEQEAVAQQETSLAGANFGGETNPRSEFWREVRQGNAGYTAVQGKETGVLIQNGGENYRALRNGPIATYGAWFVLGVAAIIALYYVVRGTTKIDGGRTGMTVERWNAVERTLHWVTAIGFVVLLVTGLSLLYGRATLIPVIGKDAFAAWANVAKNVHNYTGIVFAVSLVLFLIKLARHNLFTKADVEWFAKGGGMVGHTHPPAGRMNGGEKVWFWILSTVGVLMVVSGLFLNFPQFLDRGDAQLAHLLHAASALVLIGVAFGHIYLGTLGNEGAFEGMAKGRVDVAWAKQHHDIWYEELQEKGVKPQPAAVSPSSPGTSAGGHRPQPT